MLYQTMNDIRTIVMFLGGSMRSGVVYAREVSTPAIFDRDKSDSDESETDENRPKFANPEGSKMKLNPRNVNQI